MLCEETRLPPKPLEGEIEIKTAFGVVELPMSELTLQERTALAGLLGMKDARKNAFKTLRHMPRFKKIKIREVWNLCPKGATGFPTEIQVNIDKTNSTKKSQQATKLIKKLLPDAEVSFADHTMSGYCSRCRCVHSLSRASILVRTTVKGVPFTDMYAVNYG